MAHRVVLEREESGWVSHIAPTGISTATIRLRLPLMPNDGFTYDDIVRASGKDPDTRFELSDGGLVVAGRSIGGRARSRALRALSAHDESSFTRAEFDRIADAKQILEPIDGVLLRQRTPRRWRLRARAADALGQDEG